jgi:hypothetical protein
MSKARNLPVPLETRLEVFGRAATISAVGWVGERYYWLTFEEGDVAMVPADQIEATDSADKLLSFTVLKLPDIAARAADHRKTLRLPGDRSKDWLVITEAVRNNSNISTRMSITEAIRNNSKIKKELELPGIVANQWPHPFTVAARNSSNPSTSIIY